MYADDTQLYMKFVITNDNDRKSSLCTIDTLVIFVRAWKDVSLLKVIVNKMVALI